MSDEYSREMNGQWEAFDAYTKKKSFESSKFVVDLANHIATTHRDKYTRGGVETIDLIAAKFDLESFALGNVLKYVTRYPVTKSKHDLLKAAHYLAMVYEEEE